MKKILVLLTTSVVLSTILCANEILDMKKENICELFEKNNLEKVIMNEDVTKFYNMNQHKGDINYSAIAIGTQKGISENINNNRGNIDKLLNQINIHKKVNLTWDKLIWNYYEFNVMLLTDKEKEPTELLTFMNTIFNEQNRGEEKVITKELSDRFNTLIFMSSIYELDFKTFIQYVDYNNSRFNKLVNFIALKQFDKAYKFIVEENDKDKTIYAIDSVMNGCESSETKTLKDVIVFQDIEKKESDSVEKEIIKDKNGYVDYLYLHFKKSETEELTRAYVEGFIESYRERMMNNCNQKEVYDDKLSINMKVVMIDENRKEYGRFEINKKTCEIWKKEQDKI